MTVRPFYKYLHHFLTGCTLTTPSAYTAFHYRWISVMGARIASKKPNHAINFREGPSFHSYYHCTSIYLRHMIRLKPVPSVVCRPNYSSSLKTKNETAYKRKRYSLRGYYWKRLVKRKRKRTFSSRVSPILRRIRKTAKSDYRFVMSACLSTWNNSAPSRWIFIIFVIGLLFHNLLGKF